MEINVLIDKLTPCLEDAATGKQLQTVFSVAKTNELLDLQSRGWNFDWHRESINPKENVYKLTLRGDTEIQGLTATEVKKNAVYVALAESAPHNMGNQKKYAGVGGHLFAIAVKLSNALGFGGYIYMDAKNLELAAHYKDKLGVQQLYTRIHEYRMEVPEENAQKVLRKYTLEGDLNVER